MIIYHGGSGLTTQQRIEEYGAPVSVLQPYDVLAKKGITRLSWWDKFFLDSGAFTISQKGGEINVYDYIAFVKEWEKEIDVYASLDVVGDGEASYRNWRIMLDAGLNPLPVFHDGEPLDILFEYAKVTNYIGLGAVAFKSTKRRMIFFDQVFSLFPDPSKVGFHGFGVMSEDLLLRYPWRSVDATTVLLFACNGAILYPGYGAIRINPNVSKKDLRWKTDISEEMVRAYIEGFGLSYEKACEQTMDGTFERIFVNLHCYEEVRKKVPTVFRPKFKTLPVVQL